MKPFDLSRVNSTSPYKVELKADEYVFETDYNIRYSIWFEEQPLPDIDVMAYWLNLTNRSQKRVHTQRQKSGRQVSIYYLTSEYLLFDYLLFTIY